MNVFSIGRLRGRLLLVLLCAGTLLAAQGYALTDAERDTELRYVDGLNQLGLPTYAEMVLAQLGTGAEIKTRRLQSLLARGEFDEVLAVINAEPNQDSLDTWAMRITLADGYFAWGQYENARGIYTKLFEKYKNGPPAALKTFLYRFRLQVWPDAALAQRSQGRD